MFSMVFAGLIAIRPTLARVYPIPVHIPALIPALMAFAQGPHMAPPTKKPAPFAKGTGFSCNLIGAIPGKFSRLSS
ncbi:MAG: hypothetical protein ACR2O7_08725 [Parasphingorhabdus sp.]|jgi:hypothetical protein